MTLDQYLNKSSSPTAAEFGDLCDPRLSGASISRIRRGEQNISSDVMRSIIAASAGEVTAAGLLAKRQQFLGRQARQESEAA